MNQENPNPCVRNLMAFALLFFIILLVYSNTFHASWHFDDYHNIIENPALKIRDLGPQAIIQTFFAYPDPLDRLKDKKLYRPIPCLTFAINWYLGKDNVVGYHIVNIAIHILTAFFLFLAIINLFKSTNLKEKYQGGEYFIALLTATLWAVHPIQTQAVTYIVQRMASMAAMFYILGIYFYIKGRIHSSRLNQVFLYIGCLVSYAFALGSKEIAVTLPVALFLVEVAFFQNLALPKIRRNILLTSAGIGILVVFLGILLFLKGDPLSFLNSYANRPFNVLERLITEPRILIFYLTQLFYPMDHRLSIHHDVTISTSLFEPWTTLPAIFIVFFLIILGIAQLRKRPMIGFAICFFFLNHLIESSILPLELIFDHRNYLPSFFIFFPVSLGLKQLFDYYHENKRSVYLVLVSFLPLLLIGLGIGTYTMNMSWASEKTLWEDTMTKAPKSLRPPHNLASYHYEKIGEFDKALELYEKALQLKSSVMIQIHALSLKNMAGIYYKKKEYEKAVNLLKNALYINPGYKDAVEGMIYSLIELGRWEEASKHVDLLLKKQPNNDYYLNLKGSILLKQKKPDEAIPYFKDALKKTPDYGEALLNMGVALSLTGNHKKAQWYLLRAKRILSNDITVYFALIENSARAGDKKKVDKYSEILLNSFNLRAIENFLKEIAHENSWNPVSSEIVAPVIAQAVKRRSIEIASTTLISRRGAETPRKTIKNKNFSPWRGKNK